MLLPVFADMPKIACRELVYDFGVIENTKAVDHTFTIRNEGSAPLQIGQIRACCGASATISEKLIQPGTSAVFHVVYLLTGRSGPQTKSLYIASNDPQEPFLQLRLVGTAIESLEIAPRYVDLGTLEQGMTTNRIIKIQGRSNQVLTVTNVVTTSGFRATTSRTSDVWEICVVTTNTLPLGTTKGMLSVYFSDPDHPKADIPLNVTIAGDIVVTPKEIDLVEPVGQNITAVTRYVAFRSRSLQAFKILYMTAPDPAITVEKAELASGGYRITLRHIKPVEELNGKDFVITTDSPLMPRIAVPFNFHHLPDTAVTNKVTVK